MTATRFWDRNGRELSLLPWAYLFELRSYRFVATTTMMSATNSDLVYMVSTIWMGHDMDMWISGKHEPKIFETGVLSAEALEEYERSVTERDALRTHDDTVARIAARIPDSVIVHLPIVPSAPLKGWQVDR